MNLTDYLPRLNLRTVEFLKRIITPESLIFEIGSGNSTIWFGKQVKKVVALEGSEKWYKRIQGLIEKEGLRNVKVYFDPNYPKKQFKDILQNEDIIEYDIVLHDGPFKASSRVMAMKFIYRFVKVGGYLIVDDTHDEWCASGTRKYLDVLGWKKMDIPHARDPYRRKKSTIIYQRPI